MTGAQRSYLRGLAHGLKPVVHVGQSGLTDTVVEQVEEQLLAHELIKVRMLEPEDKKGTAASLAARVGAELCGLVGHTAILYKAHPDEPKIVLPEKG